MYNVAKFHLKCKRPKKPFLTQFTFKANVNI
jgi:hypothetical protein